MTWKFGQFLGPPSCWQAWANDPCKVLKIGGQHRVVIPFYEIKNFGVATELGAWYLCDISFAQLVYCRLHVNIDLRLAADREPGFHRRLDSPKEIPGPRRCVESLSG